MISIFDVLSVAAFLMIGAVWFFGVERKNSRTLLHFALAAVTLAVGNQVGNAGWAFLAVVLIVASCGYVFVLLRT